MAGAWWLQKIILKGRHSDQAIKSEV
jgi:hypothetical protein